MAAQVLAARHFTRTIELRLVWLRNDQERKEVLENFTQLLHSSELDLIVLIPMPIGEARPARDRVLSCQIYSVELGVGRRCDRVY